MKTVPIIGIVLLLCACGASDKTISKRTLAATSGGFDPSDLYSGPCTSVGVKINLNTPGLSLGTDGRADDFANDERLGQSLALLRERLPLGISPRIDGKEARGETNHFDVSYEYLGFPVCDLSSRIHLFKDAIRFTGAPKRHALAGKKIDDHELLGLSNPWPDHKEILDAIASHLRIEDPADIQVQAASKCVVLDPGKVTPSWDLRVLINGISFDVLGRDSDIRSISTATFFANGIASYYQNNPKNGSLTELELDGLQDDVTTLKGMRFYTIRGDGIAPAERADRRYLYTPKEPEFDEVNVYANAERVASWLQGSIPNYNLDCLPISLSIVGSLNSKTGSTTDNARYTPPKRDQKTKTRPNISIGPGGTDLLFLRQDYDVLAHEMGHHVLSRTLGGSTFDSVAIQEGLADFLVYAQTGDACLAESICPDRANGACSLPGECLRSGLTTRDFEPTDRNPYAPGEVLSSILWKVASEKDVGLNKMAEIVVGAVTYFKKDSKFQDLFRALYQADKDLNGGASACRIEAEARNRGFAEVLQDVPCKDF
jgi:hypothetical protein